LVSPLIRTYVDIVSLDERSIDCFYEKTQYLIRFMIINKQT
jgi:hypothetical protein